MSKASRLRGSEAEITLPEILLLECDSIEHRPVRANSMILSRVTIPARQVEVRLSLYRGRTHRQGRQNPSK